MGTGQVSDIHLHQLVDRLVPKMKCREGCGDCCGVVMCAPSEAKQVRQYAKRNGIKPVKQGTKCPWFQGGECKVYDVRPYVCRIFGHFSAQHCQCFHGLNRNVTIGVENELVERYRAMLSKSPDTAMLHSVCYSEDEIAELVRVAMKGGL